jgi:hypothetical protein
MLREMTVLLISADDKSKRLALLEDLQKSPLLDARQKKWLREELGRYRKGIQGEKDSAYYLDQYFKGGQNHVILHDLRFVVEGDVAQIDHLIINRGFGCYLIETKNYAGNLTINDHGEFTAEYDDDRFGIPSPIEQSRRHERILQRLLTTLEITNRTGAPLDCYHVVMLHPKAIIRRPPVKAFDTSNVIKNRALRKRRSSAGERCDKSGSFTAALSASADTPPETPPAAGATLVCLRCRMPTQRAHAILVRPKLFLSAHRAQHCPEASATNSPYCSWATGCPGTPLVGDSAKNSHAQR